MMLFFILLSRRGHQITMRKKGGDLTEQAKESKEYQVFAAGVAANGEAFNPAKFGIASSNRSRYEGWYQAGKIERSKLIQH